MNKYKTALSRLLGHIVQTSMFPNSDDKWNNKLFEEDRKTLWELVEKATPKKPKYTYFNNMLVNYHCPNCGEAQGLNVNKWWNRFCPGCGQALDWSEDTKKL